MAKIRRTVGWVLAAAILIFLGQALVSSWDQVVKSGFEFHIRWPLFVVSLLLLVVGRGFAVEAWRRILWALGDTMPYRPAFRAWFLSNLARYVPGNVWQVATMIVMVEREGVSRTNALLSQVIYSSIALANAGLIGLALLPLGNWAWFVGLALVALIIVLAQPRVFSWLVLTLDRLMTWARARWKSNGTPSTNAPAERVRRRPALTFWRGLAPPAASAAMWLTNGVAFYLFLASVVDVKLETLPHMIAINAAAYFIGYVSFVTPSGLGFREGAVALLLSPFFPTPVAVALAFANRLWLTAGELLGVLIALLPMNRPPKPALSETER